MTFDVYPFFKWEEMVTQGRLFKFEFKIAVQISFKILLEGIFWLCLGEKHKPNLVCSA